MYIRKVNYLEFIQQLFKTGSRCKQKRSPCKGICIIFRTVFQKIRFIPAVKLVLFHKSYSVNRNYMAHFNDDIK